MSGFGDEQIEALLLQAAFEASEDRRIAAVMCEPRNRTTLTQRARVTDDLSVAVRELLERARKAEAENRRLIADRAANEKANIESRRSICEQSDRYKAERDALRDGNQAIVETCERIALERDEWKREALGKRAAFDVLSAERDDLAAKLRAVEALAERVENRMTEIRAALSADTTPEPAS